MASGGNLVDTGCMTATASAAVIRQWARDNGLRVGERGRLSPQLLTAYATTGQAEPPARQTASLPAPPRLQHVRREVRIPVQPTPGATGLARTVAARSS